jgi:hypothetical protein
MADSDCVMVMGSNMAENHPVAFRWPMQAKVNGATLIHVDPRFTRTSAMADIYADPRRQRHRVPRRPRQLRCRQRALERRSLLQDVPAALHERRHAGE